jgi:hypothetical protein
MGTCCAKESDGPIGDGNHNGSGLRKGKKDKSKGNNKLNKYATATGATINVDGPISTTAAAAAPGVTEKSPAKPGTADKAVVSKFDVVQVPVEDDEDEYDERANQLKEVSRTLQSQLTGSNMKDDVPGDIPFPSIVTTAPPDQRSPGKRPEATGTSATRRTLHDDEVKPLPIVLDTSHLYQSHVSEAASSFSTPAVLAATTGPGGAPRGEYYNGFSDKSSSVQFNSTPPGGAERDGPPLVSDQQNATAPPMIAAAAPPKVANVLASLLPVEDADRRRKEREEMLSTNEVSKPKMIEFDVNFDDDDLIAVEDMGDDAEVVEDFVMEVDDDDEDGGSGVQHHVNSGDRGLSAPDGTPSKKKQPAMSVVFDGISGVHQPPQVKASVVVNVPPSTNTVSATPTVTKGAAFSPATNVVLNKKWFTDRGVAPPKSIQWKQDKRTVTVYIAPADGDSGWELSADGLLLDFTSTAGDRGNVKIVLPLLHPLVHPEFRLNSATSVLTFVGTKVPTTPPTDDEDDEDEPEETALPYWTQLIRGTRKEYTALTFISRLLDDDDDDEDEGESYEYGKPGAVADCAFGDTFSDPED